MLKPSSSYLIFAGLSFVTLFVTLPAEASHYALHDGGLGLTYDPVTLGNGEPLGLLGFHALISEGRYGYLGVSGFGAVHGKRGGFLAGGYSAGLHIPLSRRLTGDLSFFLGGGGGGAAPQGGGLMLREQAGIDYLAGRYRVGAGVSHIHFPNGEIDSVQPCLSFQLPFSLLYASGWETGELAPEDFPQTLYDHDTSIALSFKQYHGHSLFRSPVQPAATISTIGAEWRQQAWGGFYYTFSAHGAYEGSAAGFAEVMAGGGYRWNLTRNSAIGLALDVGSGGGGNVDTGGGLLGSFTLNMEQKLSKQFFLSIHGGYARAMQGAFGGRVLGITLGMQHTNPSTTGWDASELATLPYSPIHYRLRLVQQRYYPGTAIPRSDSSVDGEVDLTGLQIDMMRGRYFYLTGQALEAWRGKAGGYASGMVGGGLSLPLSRRFALKGELLTGAAGGGGIDVGDGLVAGGSLLAIARLTDSLDLETGYGRIAAYKGGLDARQFSVAIAYSFTHPER